MRITGDAVVGVVLLVVAGLYFWHAQGLPAGRAGDPGPALFPDLLALCLVVLAVWLIVKSLVASRAAEPAIRGRVGPGLGRAGAAIALSIAFVALFLPLGFVIATALYTAALTLVFRRDSLLLPALVPIIAVGGLYLLFGVLLSVRLPLWPA